MEENTNSVIYSNGIIIFNIRPEEEAPKLSIKAGELYELAKHNIILLRTEANNPINNVSSCLILQTFGSVEENGEKHYYFNFSDAYRFQAETADDYPTKVDN